MTATEWLQLFLQQLSQTSWIERISVCFGIAEVLFARNNNVWLYPTGIISVTLGSYLFFTSGLYAESVLNLYYLLMSIYGWWFWVYRRKNNPVPITTSSRKDWILACGIVAVAFIVLYIILRHFTDSTVPFADAIVSATAWAGMWLLAKRKLENWILLNISNAIAVPLLFYKQLPLYALLTIFLFIIAVNGYFKWKKDIYEKSVPL
jgi:nicotinamide mononucleotide transporter